MAFNLWQQQKINQNKSHSQRKQNKIKENPALKEQKHEGDGLTLRRLPLQIYSVICVLHQCGVLATISNQHRCTPVTWCLHGSTVSLAWPFSFSFSSLHCITLRGPVSLGSFWLGWFLKVLFCGVGMCIMLVSCHVLLQLVKSRLQEWSGLSWLRLRWFLSSSLKNVLQSIASWDRLATHLSHGAKWEKKQPE